MQPVSFGGVEARQLAPGQLFMLAGAQDAYRCCEHLIRVYRCCVPAPQHRPECALDLRAAWTVPATPSLAPVLPTHPLRRTPHTCTSLTPITGTVIAIDVQLSWIHTARPTLDQPPASRRLPPFFIAAATRPSSCTAFILRCTQHAASKHFDRRWMERIGWRLCGYNRR